LLPVARVGIGWRRNGPSASDTLAGQQRKGANGKESATSKKEWPVEIKPLIGCCHAKARQRLRNGKDSGEDTPSGAHRLGRNEVGAPSRDEGNDAWYQRTDDEGGSGEHESRRKIR